MPLPTETVSFHSPHDDTFADLVVGVVYHLRYELLFTGVFLLVVLLSKRGAGSSKAKGSNAAALAATITELCATKYGKAMDLFLDEDPATFRSLPDAEFLKLASALAMASVRVGRTERLGLLFARVRLRCQQDPGVLSPVMRMLSSRHQHAASLKVLESWEAVFKGDQAPAPALSCAVHGAVELGDEASAARFLAQLEGRGEVTSRDYSAMIRLHVQAERPERALAVLRQVESLGLKADNVSYNMVLSACSNARQKDEVTTLLQGMEADVVTFNTRLKACVQDRDVAQAFAIFADLEKAGIQPTQVTYGTLVECCTRAGAMDQARGVLQKMAEAGLPKNIVVYTSLIKGFAALGKLEDAMEVFAEMQDAAEAEKVEPDVICYSALIKAFCDRQDLEQALSLLEDLLDKGHMPDEILFNHLLAGCAAKPHVQLGEKILVDMVAHGIKPTTATFSTMLKVYAKAGDLHASAELLEKIPTAYGSQPAQRLYLQHISWAIRTRKGASALQVFKLMHARLPAPVNCDATLLACLTFNMLDTAVGLLEVDSAWFSIGARQQIADTLVKKKKDQLLDRLQKAA